MSLRKLGILCGILSPLLWLALIVCTGALQPGFNLVTHYISELGARGSASEFLIRIAAFGFTGFLYLCFAIALLASAQGAWFARLAAVLIGLDGVGRMGAGLFPCDAGCVGVSMGQELHHLFATVGFISGILAAIAWGIVFFRRGGQPIMAWYSVGSGILVFILLVLMTWAGNPIHAIGLFEHLASLFLSLWMMVFAVCMMRVTGDV